MSAAQLASYRRERTFLRDPHPVVVLDRDMVIRAANPAYLRATVRAESDLMSLPLLEAFPANPDDPTSGVAAKNLIRSFEDTLRLGRPQHLMLLRYDVPDAQREQYLTRFWVPVCHPVIRAGEVIGVSWQADSLPPLEAEAVATIEEARDLILSDDSLDEGSAERLSGALSCAMQGSAALAREVTQLRGALESRVVIEQAKGVLMAREGCTPDEAFDELRRLSQETHVRVAEVAQAVVYHATGSRRDG